MAAFPKCSRRAKVVLKGRGCRRREKKNAWGARNDLTLSHLHSSNALHTLENENTCSLYTLFHTHTIQQTHHLLSTHSLHMQTLRALLPTTPLPFSQPWPKPISAASRRPQGAGAVLQRDARGGRRKARRADAGHQQPHLVRHDRGNRGTSQTRTVAYIFKSQSVICACLIVPV